MAARSKTTSTSTFSAPDAPRIEMVPLGAVRGAARNPKTHALDRIALSIRRFGFVAPLVIDEASGRLVAGHGRAAALRQMRSAKEAPPDRVVDTGDDWLVPVLRGVSFGSEKEAEAYLLADNRVQELGGWDTASLLEMVRDIREDQALLAASGWTDREASKLVQLGQRGRVISEVEVQETEQRVNAGEVWDLGAHVLVCGDSRLCWDHVDSQIDLVMTDPPYGVAYTGGGTRAPIASDSDPNVAVALFSAVWSAALERMKPGAPFFVWCASGPLMCSFAQVLGANFRQTLIWKKDQLVMGRRDFHSLYEPCLYGWAPGSHARPADRTLVDLVEFPRPKVSKEHPTMKPIALIAHFLQAVGGSNDLVVDPFGGSGTTLLACEQLGMRCRTVELEPKYASVIVDRWERLTGGKAVRRT